MPAKTRRLLCAVIGLLTMALPAAAQAAEKTVQMGVPRASQRTFQSTFSDVNDFFPHRVTIHVGDTVRFVPAGFHTVDLPGRQTAPVPLFVPTGQPVAGSADAAAAPFWFNGQPAIGFNPALGRPGFGRRLTYSGAVRLLSGAPAGNRPKAMVVRFTRTGSFRYFCDVHLGMTGRVVVRRSRSSIPSANADRAAVRTQLADGLRRARALSATKTAPPNTIDVGLQSGNVSFFAFVPSALTVPVGTTVAFRLRARSEVHTATTGPGDPEKQPTSYLGQITASFDGPVPDPRALYPSDPPGALAALTPVFHGNGFWSSGALDLNPGTPSPPASAVRFTAPGVYQVFCLIHPFMHGTVTVQ